MKTSVSPSRIQKDLDKLKARKADQSTRFKELYRLLELANTWKECCEVIAKYKTAQQKLDGGYVFNKTDSNKFWALFERRSDRYRPKQACNATPATLADLRGRNNMDIVYTISNGVMEIQYIAKATSREIPTVAPRLHGAPLVNDWESAALPSIYNNWEEERVFDGSFSSEEYEVTNTIEFDDGSKYVDTYMATAYEMKDHTQIDSENDFFETFKSTPNDVDKLDYFTPEDSFGDVETEYSKNDILDQLDYLHHTEISQSRSPQARQASYELYIDKLCDAQNLKELSAVQKEFRKAVANSVVTTDAGVEIPTLLPKGKMAEFWETYRSFKKTLEAEAEEESKAIKSQLESYTDAQDIRALREIIHNHEKLSWNDKKALKAECSKKLSA